MKNRILIICDSGRTASPLVQGILNYYIHKSNKADTFISAVGAFAGKDQREIFEPIKQIAISNGYKEFNQKTVDVSEDIISNSTHIIICDPDSQDFITNSFTTNGKNLYFLPNYYRKQVLRSFPNPANGSIDTETFHSLIFEATKVLWSEELGP